MSTTITDKSITDPDYIVSAVLEYLIPCEGCQVQPAGVCPPCLLRGKLQSLIPENPLIVTMRQLEKISEAVVATQRGNLQEAVRFALQDFINLLTGGVNNLFPMETRPA